MSVAKHNKRNRRGKVYLFNVSLVNMGSLMYKFNSAFLFSTARNNARRPIVKINQGENPISEAATPERALNIKPDAIHKTSRIGTFLRLDSIAFGLLIRFYFNKIKNNFLNIISIFLIMYLMIYFHKNLASLQKFELFSFVLLIV